MDTVRYPKFIKKGDTLGFVAPSFGCSTEPYYSAFKHALEQFEKKGYHTSLGPNCFASDGIGISSTPRSCGKELTDFYCDPASQLLISCGGGELMCEILDYVDFDRIRQAEPKWFLGYSDNTNFTLLSVTLCDTAAIYGPNAGAFGMEPWHSSISDTFDFLNGKTDRVHNYEKWEKESLKDKDHPLEPYHCTEPFIIKKFLPEAPATYIKPEAPVASSLKAADNSNFEKEIRVQFSGRLIGGCLDCLGNLAGTGYDHVHEFNSRYASDGIIWFLEACDLDPIGIRRTLWQLKHAGWFEHVKGFLIGRPHHFGEEIFGLDQYEAVTSMLAEYNVPILMDLDIGHVAPAMPIAAGATAEVTCTDNQLEICYTWK